MTDETYQRIIDHAEEWTIQPHVLLGGKVWGPELIVDNDVPPDEPVLSGMMIKLCADDFLDLKHRIDRNARFDG